MCEVTEGMSIQSGLSRPNLVERYLQATSPEILRRRNPVEGNLAGIATRQQRPIAERGDALAKFPIQPLNPVGDDFAFLPFFTVFQKRIELPRISRRQLAERHADANNLGIPWHLFARFDPKRDKPCRAWSSLTQDRSRCPYPPRLPEILPDLLDGS